jgi:hypothetical protein
MDIETYSRREEDLALAQRLSAIELARLSGTNDYSLKEFRQNMLEAINQGKAEKVKLRTLFELSGFCRDWEETLKNKVDVVTTASLTGDFKERIEKDMVLIYG